MKRKNNAIKQDWPVDLRGGLAASAPPALLFVIFITTVISLMEARHRSAVSEYVIGGVLVFGVITLIAIRRGLSQIRQLDQANLVDALTGLPSREAFHADYRHAVAQGEELAVAIVDLDGFLMVNEHHGLAVGDEVLRHCSAILRALVGTEAKIYRMGGDEFALLMHGKLAGTLLEGLCRNTIERLSRPLRVYDRSLTLGASIGLSRCTPSEPASASEMLRRADVSMYASKRGGKGRCTWFTAEFDASRAQTRDIDEDLRQALVYDQFNLLYQPLVDCDTAKVACVEALLRWHRPDGKSIGPDVFVPVAEQSGLILPIGLWVLRRACMDALAWDGVMLSVNISAAQLRNAEFPVQLGQILEETGFDPSRLELEITETCLVLDPVVAERSLAMIRNFGVNVVLDDFGTGYASFGFLRQFRFEKLKIDRSLVEQAGTDEASRAVMLSSVTVARAMRMKVTAEGVETEEQARMVRAAGCDQIQGWLYFKAMPAAEIAHYLNRPLDIATLHLIHESEQPELFDAMDRKTA
ncbi:MAG: bifunctional diguanylate cyclase/phosphodiesterase [Sphingomonadaceae bacterium]